MILQDDFTKENFEEVVNSINQYTNNLTPSDFKGKKVTISNIPAGEFNFSHSLGKIPEFRYIIRQVGGGLITDSTTQNDSKNMYLYNNGGTITELIILVG